MRVNKIKIRIITLGIILLFILSAIGTIFVVNVSAEWEKLEEDGIWYDEFTDTVSVNLDSNCVHNSGSNGYFLLGEGNPSYEYNYSGQSKNINVWEHREANLEGSSISQLLFAFISPNLNPGDSITDATRLENIKYLDKTKTLDTLGVKLTQNNPTPANPIQHYRFIIDQEQDLIERFTINWWYGNYDQLVFLKDIDMYLWSYGDLIPKWENVATIPYNETKTNFNDYIADISYSFGNDEYLSEDGYIDIVLIGTPTGPLPEVYHNAILKTDFINISVKTIKGYWPQGTITSDIIEIEEEFAGWESIFWTSTRYGNVSGVTIQVLDELEKPIPGFSGTSFPLDISEIEQNKIKLRATLHSNSPKKTPRIYNWGVMWQKPNNYKDTFANNFRIEQTTGVIIENGEIKVSEFFSDWEFFGKNSANTRSYNGKTLTSMPTAYYWYSNFGFGGGFRSPVVSEGKVYIASKDKRIYAFNETQDSPIISQKPVDNSNVLNFEVEACIAVAEDYLIVGTSEPGKKNKIYALNKNDLSEKIWEYPPSNQTICFTAPPVIDNGRIFISSWGGTIWDTPFLSFVGSIFGKNNKLIALNLDDGSEIWEPKKLPSGSLSAPVIGNNFIYVGCQNMYGSNLLAYDLESGDKLWNQTIGLIGRSSPVYADETIFVCANEKDSIRDSGENKIFAVDAMNGDILWNQTIGQIDPTSLIYLFKGSSFFYKLIEGFAPITTPAFYDNTLYVVTPNGTLLALETDGDEKWSFDLSSAKILNIFSFYTASPLIVGDMVYIATGNGFVYAFDVDNSELIVEPSWSYELETPGEYQYEFGRPSLIASPVLADGLLYISSTEDANLTGRIYCLGGYSPNNKGNVTSTTIHVPIGHWWQSFKANKTDTITNTIKLSILDENDNTLKTFSNYNNISDSISDLTSNGIKLYASFEITNPSDTQPSLDSWELTWVEEKEPPVFIYSDEDELLYANQNLQEISIEVKDIADDNVISGLDLTTAQFRIGYIPKNSNTPKLSGWLAAESDDKPGSRVIQTVITANLADLDFEVARFNNITFRIKDLAGNLATSNTSDFKIDTEKPKSYILDKEAFKNIYNKKVTITADAYDLGDAENISGISKVSLIYWYKELEDDDWGNLQYYENKTQKTYSWSFGELNGKTIKSGWYRISTMAKDKAGNIEDINLTNSITILFDSINPSLHTQFDDKYIKKELPRFELEISDDYILESLEYRLESETTWYTIEDGIDDKSFKVNWSLAENIWAAWDEGSSQYIFFRVKDYCENKYETNEENSPLIEKINMDDFYIDLSDFNEWHWDDTFTITPSVPDYLNVKQVQIFYSFSKDKKNWTDYKQYDGNLTVYPYKWQFTAVEGSGYYKFYTKITTLEGDVYTTPEQIITATILPAGLFAILLILTTILTLVTATVIYKIKQKKKYQ